MVKKVLDAESKPIFEFLREYKNIVVSGPQRSGTTACAGFIMTDLGRGKITRVSGGINIDQLAKACEAKGEKVIHAAGCTFGLHREDIGGRDDTAIIWMWRDLEDVHKSEKRINWRPGAEFGRYNTKNRDEVAPAKIKMFLEEQKDKIKHIYEIDYTELEKHPLYVPPELRTSFSSRTWQVPKTRAQKGRKAKVKPVPRKKKPAQATPKPDPHRKRRVMEKRRLVQENVLRRKKKLKKIEKEKEQKKNDSTTET